MPYLIGILLGSLLGRIGFFRAAGAALLLGATAFLAHMLVSANVSADLAWAASIFAPLALFAWAVWNPAGSKLRLWIVDGVYLAARLAMWGLLVACAEVLFAAQFSVGEWLRQAWPFAAAAAAMWGVQWLLGVQTARSHRIMGDRSVVEV